MKSTRTNVRRRFRAKGLVVVVVLAAGAAVLSAWIPAAIAGWRAVRNTPPAVICETTVPGESGPRVLLSWSAPASQRWRTEPTAPSPVATNGGATFSDADAASLIGMATKRVGWPRFLPVPETKPGFAICSDAFGWPWMCMQRITTFQAMPDGSTQVDFRPRREDWNVWMFQMDGKWYMIPLRPIWRGFIGNSAVFGAMFAVVWMGPRMVRRATRRSGGRCQSCGYSLAGSVAERCPECGEQVCGAPVEAGGR